MEVIFLLILVMFGFPFYVWWLRHTTKSGAPYEGMPANVVERVMKIAKVGQDDVFYDLGSGDGRLVIAASMRGAKAVGIEIDKLRALYSLIWIKLLRLKKAKIINADIFKTDVSDATVVCTYLLPETHEKLKAKLKKELKPSVRLIAVGFEYENWKPETVDPRGTIYGPIAIYKFH